MEAESSQDIFLYQDPTGGGINSGYFPLSRPYIYRCRSDAHGLSCNKNCAYLRITGLLAPSIFLDVVVLGSVPS